MCGGRVEEGTLPLLADFRGLAWHLPCFQSLHPLPICDWRPSSCCPGCGSQSGWVCLHCRLSWESGSPEFLQLPQRALIFTARSYEALFFLVLEPLGVWSDLGRDLLTHKMSPWFLSTTREFGTACSASASLPPACHHCATSSLPWHPGSDPSTCLDRYSFLKSLVVGLLYSSIFWQFWVFFHFEISCDPSYGCTWRRSMSAYASILTGSQKKQF